MTNRIWQNFLASNIHRGINKVAAQKSSSNIVPLSVSHIDYQCPISHKDKDMVEQLIVHSQSIKRTYTMPWA